eukprot:6140093-Lingulodinium_polyedra.AAC.1
MVEDITAMADTGGGHQAEASAELSDTGRLSTIEEVSEETNTSMESAGSYLKHSDEAFQLVLAAIEEDFHKVLEPEAEPVPYDDAQCRMPLSLLNIPEDDSMLTLYSE